jgi:hypothetical protein
MGGRSRGPTFVVTFQAVPGVDAIKALRFMLKSALRRYGLRCISVSEDIVDVCATITSTSGP